MKRFAFQIAAAMSMLACAIGLAGCGYHAGFLIPADVHTVSVRMAQNQTFWREALKTDNVNTEDPLPTPRPAYTMEVEFTERLKGEVVRRTPLRLADEENADSVLIATISKVELTVLMRDAKDNAAAERVRIVVDFTWRDRRSGRVLAEGKGITRPTDYLTAHNENFTTAARESFDYLAMMVVERMQEGF